ncbi:uncharacterized protein LACBIDRAFT_302744 [Laccaria bicolor S238N-H82]|uniref:Predicted protein n=1 Tax=Laccaria bicolor (strain S238N-H82 / ATCC MYA-4686) TaxID=486041 RepID=B0DI69_LACBS|nr:uncharacterized protein LACBIDRAFT_302744 [Laccaria bicolor S238N-H82]EDR05625.1 predicted protein [Laccaria bicolor S238N-H82]|eukprot:XP_001883729.1 predicted protein [Laccaria bicolor S238N-H82]
MEHTIGDFGRDIWQPSNPFANLCQIALQCTQTNTCGCGPVLCMACMSPSCGL